MNQDNRTSAADPVGNRFELEPDAGFPRALAQVDFSRGSRVRDRVRARVLSKALKEFKEQQPGRNWMKRSRASLSFIGGIILLVIAAIALGWGFENLVPQKGANLFSGGIATAAPTIEPSRPASTPTSGQGTGGRIAWPRDNQPINGLVLDDRYVYFSAGPGPILRQSLNPSQPLQLEEFAPLQYPSPNTDGTLQAMPRMLKEHWLYYVDVGDGTAAPRWTLRAKNTQTLAEKVVITGNTCLDDFSVDGDTLAWIEKETEPPSAGQARQCLGDSQIKTIQLSSGLVKILDRTPSASGSVWLKIAVSGNRLASLQGSNQNPRESKTVLFDLNTGKSELLPTGALEAGFKTCVRDIALAGPWLACSVSEMGTALYNFDTHQTQSFMELFDTELGRNAEKIEGEWLVWSGHTQGNLYNLVQRKLVQVLPTTGRSTHFFEVAVSGPTVAWITLEASAYVIHWQEIPLSQVPPTATPTIGPVQTPVIPPNTFVTPADGAELMVRSGPGTRYDWIGQLKGGEKAPALGKTSLGEWIKISLPGTPDGTGWVYAGLVTISGAELPVIADASVNPSVVTPGVNLLGMQSSPEEIRNLILHPGWSVVWVDGQAVHYNPNGSNIRFFVQAWLERTGGGRIISSNQLENITTRTPDLLPKWVWLHDGKTLQVYDTETRSFDPSMARMRWSVHPLEMASELMQILSPYFLENMGDQPIQTVREETFASRPALVIDWGQSRFWVDETSGVLLRQQGFSTSDHSGQPQSDLFLSQIRYQSQLPGDLFDPNQLNQLRFQEPPIEPTTVPQGQPEALDAIRKFSHQEVTSYTVQQGTMDPNVPGTKVDQYIVNDATYYVDPQTGRIVEFSGPLYATEDSQTYSPETLEQMAMQLVQEQLPKINLQDYQLQRSNKSEKNFFFRWSKGAAGEPGYLTFVQVGYTLHGKLIGYINALAAVYPVLPSKTSTPLPGSPTPAAGKPAGRVYFSQVSSGDPWTKIAWLALDCLAGQNACQPAIQTLPLSVQKNMAGKLAWSPDGKQFALESNPDGNAAQDIFVVDANGEHLLNLTHSPERESNPAWSPDGAYLLYVKNFTVENITRSEIWVSRPDGTDQRKVADGNVAAWSPDGQQILYAAAEGPAGKPIIAIANRSGGDPIWGKTVQNSVRDLAWSPDGSKFVISSVDGIFSMDRDGSHATQLAPDLVGISNIAWSPGGQWIAFFAHASRQAPPNLYTIRADGSGLVNLTNSNLGGQFGFSWSPDGHWLVYDSAKDTGHGNIFISNADGSQQYQLTQSSGNRNT